MVSDAGGGMGWQVSTGLGDVPVRGRISADPDRPVLLVMRGLFSGRDYLAWLADALPGQRLRHAVEHHLGHGFTRFPGRAGAVGLQGGAVGFA